MTDDETKRVNRLIAALTNQRNSALNEAAQYAATIAERDETIAQLQQIIAVQSQAEANRAQPPFADGAPALIPRDERIPSPTDVAGDSSKGGNGETNVN